METDTVDALERAEEMGRDHVEKRSRTSRRCIGGFLGLRNVGSGFESGC
jgi:hypothetical protein